MTRNPFFQQRRRLRKVVDYIGEAIDDDLPQGELSLRRLADIACWSPEHLDRAYRRARGESPLATVRRLRLQRAGRALQAGCPLGEVAERAGYASTQAFGRALRREQPGDEIGRWQRAAGQVELAALA
jgi:AraC family transcriptional regulator